jgi:uncharacterized membrane protein
MASAKDILDERLARGEITVDEYEDVLRKISSDVGSAINNAHDLKGGVKKIESEDSVVNVSNYTGVKTSWEFITNFNGFLGLLNLFIGFFAGNPFAAIGIIMLIIAFLSLMFSNSVNVYVLKGENWVKVGKFTYPKSEEIKKMLVDSM